MLNYLDLTREDIAALDRESTLFVSVVAPLEVHGSHLPVGTDLFVAEGILLRTVEELHGWQVVRLPDLVLGAQAIPAPGSFKVRGKVLQAAMTAWGSSLSALGFRYWMVFDNHGGATHQIAEVAAALILYRKGFCLMVPFLPVFQEMTVGDPAIGLPPGRNGDAADAHAGTNETSLMLALDPQKVRPTFTGAVKWGPSKQTTMGRLGRALGQPLLGMAMDWFAAPDNPHYVGDPSQASAEAGETMIAYHVKRSLEILAQARAGLYCPKMPYPLFVRILTKCFE
jgi:creatinine amidohydrolase